MSWGQVAVLAVIPARGGSKGIPKKNLQRIGGLSLLGHAARMCATLPFLDAAVLSTDDPVVAEEGKLHGLAIPFTRPPELATDQASSVSVWRHAWLSAEEAFGRRYDVSILLEPTSPLRVVEDVNRTVAAVIDDGVMAAATISPTPGHFTPHKTLTITPSGEIGFYLEDGARYAIRQRIPKYFHRNGLCYAVRRQHLVDHELIIEQHCTGIIIDRPVVNIDDPFDLELAEWLYQRRSGHIGTRGAKVR